MREEANRTLAGSCVLRLDVLTHGALRDPTGWSTWTCGIIPAGPRDSQGIALLTLLEFAPERACSTTHLFNVGAGDS